MRKCANISLYMRRQLAIYGFATAPFWISLYMRKIWFSFYQCMHCKDKIPKFRNKYSHKRNIGASVPISTFMFLWVIYIFPQSVCLFCWRKYVDRSWDYINPHRDMNVEIGAEAALFPEKEYISGIFVAVWMEYNSSLWSCLKHNPLNLPESHGILFFCLIQLQKQSCDVGLFLVQSSLKSVL